MKPGDKANKPRPVMLALALATASLTVTAVPAQPGNERQRQLRQVLAQNCSVCHGHSLQGNIGPALTAGSLSGKSEEMLVATILEGRAGTVMPAWAWLLKEDEARWLVRYLRKTED